MSEGVTNERGIEFSSKWFLTATLITPSSPRGSKKRAADGVEGRGGEGRGPVLPNSRDKVQGTGEQVGEQKEERETRGGKERRKVETGLLANAFVGCWPGSRRSSASRKD